MKERVIGAVALVVIAVLVVPVFLDGPSTDAEIVTESVTLPGQNDQSMKRQTIVLERDRDQPVPVSASRNAQATTAAEKLAADDAARKAAAAAAEPDPVAPNGANEGTQERKATQAAAEAAAPTTIAKADPEAESTANSGANSKANSEANSDANSKASPEASTNPESRQPATAQSTSGMWAVQLGSFSNQANAEKLAADLRQEGYAAFLSQLKTSSGALHRVRVGPQKDRVSAESVATRLGGEGHKGQVVPHP